MNRDPGPVRMRLALAGGGTGGHVVPGLHLLAELADNEALELEDLVWFGAGRPVEERVLTGLAEAVGDASWERVVLHLEPDGGGAPSLGGLGLRLLPAVRRARRTLAQHRTEVLLGLGGFTTVPAVLAARSLGIPVALLEINAVPGRATRWLARWARRVFHAWPASLPSGAATERDVHVGPPLAPALTRGLDPARVSRFQSEHGLDPTRPLLLVLGGSQGALGLNRFLAEHALTLVASGANVLHQVGPGRLGEAAPSTGGYRALEYIDDVPCALAAATLVLCRGGASTLAEIGALARPAWVVPYPHHPDRHQERNARMLGEGVRIVPESDLTGERAQELCELLSPAGVALRERMSQALGEKVPTDAAGRIVRSLAEWAER